MENAIWSIIYDLPTEGRDEYLNWLHKIHIPQSLSRKDYHWVAHYEIIPIKYHMAKLRSNGPPLPVDTGYVILYGGDSTRTFFDPSPTQLKDRYDTETLEMVSRRIRPVSYIHTVEWRIDGLEFKRRDPSGMPSSFIEMGCFDASGQDEELGTWYAQERMDLWSRVPGSVGCRKLLATVGYQRHGVLYDFNSLELFQKHFPAVAATEWSSRIHIYLQHPVGSSFIGRRIWPLM
jgi:hypothetical protein